MSKVTSLENMFYGCLSVSSLPNISKWDISNIKNVKDMKSIFTKCYSLISLPDISRLRISFYNIDNDIIEECILLLFFPKV